MTEAVSLSEPIESALAELVAVGRVLEAGGHGDKVLGHVTWRDPDGRGFWMKRSGISLAELSGPEDFVLVDFDGRKLAGEAPRHAEWPIHGEIFLACPDINFIGHTHPYAAGVMATTEQDIRPLTRAGATFPNGVPRYRETSNLVITKEMGRDVAEAMGDANTLLMRNHGLTYGGATAAECVLAGLMTEYACQTELQAAKSGLAFAPAEGNRRAAVQSSAAETEATWESLKRCLNGRTAPRDDNMLAQTHRVLANEGLAFLNFGAVGLRDGEDGYLTKKAGLAMGEIAGVDDLVRISNANPVGGGLPECAAEVFTRRGDVNAIVYSCAPATALFSAARETLAPTGDEGKHFENMAHALPADGSVGDLPDNCRAVFLPNDGALVLGPSLEIAGLRALFLEQACSVQLDAAASGLDWGWLPDSDQGVVGMTLEGQGQVRGFWDFYCRKLARAERGESLPGE